MSRVLISMPENFLDEIDLIAKKENRSRSELIREALRRYMTKNRSQYTTKINQNAEILEALLD